MINEAFATGCFPEPLKIARVTPLLNGGCSNSTNCYHPISIINVIGKIVEKLVFVRLSTFLSKHNIIAKHQYGFRYGHSTGYASLDLKEKIISNVSQN